MMSRNTVCQVGRRMHTVVWRGRQRRHTAFIPLDLYQIIVRLFKPIWLILFKELPLSLLIMEKY